MIVNYCLMMLYDNKVISNVLCYPSLALALPEYGAVAEFTG